MSDISRAVADKKSSSTGFGISSFLFFPSCVSLSITAHKTNTCCLLYYMTTEREAKKKSLPKQRNWNWTLSPTQFIYLQLALALGNRVSAAVEAELWNGIIIICGECLFDKMVTLFYLSGKWVAVVVDDDDECGVKCSSGLLLFSSFNCERKFL